MAHEHTSPLILFGGTFDPVHRAHIHCAREVSRLFDHSPVLLLPNAAPPHRNAPNTSAEHRLAMLQLACQGEPDLQIEDWELRQDSPSYSLLTLQHFRSKHPKRPLMLMIGADSFAKLDHWHAWQMFPALCHLIVVPRPSAPAPSAVVLTRFPEADKTALLSQLAGSRLMLTQPQLDISSTTIRHTLANKGYCTSLNDRVWQYIQQHHLYNLSPNPNTDEDS